jgi:hypothetical protein
VLAWDVVVDTLSEDEYDPKNDVGLSTAHLVGSSLNQGVVFIEKT